MTIKLSDAQGMESSRTFRKRWMGQGWWIRPGHHVRRIFTNCMTTRRISTYFMTIRRISTNFTTIRRLLANFITIKRILTNFMTKWIDIVGWIVQQVYLPATLCLSVALSVYIVRIYYSIEMKLLFYTLWN